MCCFPFFEMPNMFYWTNSFLPAMTIGLMLFTQSDFRFAVHFFSTLSITLRLNRTSEVLKCCFQTSIWLTTVVSLWLPCTIPSHHWSPCNNTGTHPGQSNSKRVCQFIICDWSIVYVDSVVKIKTKYY